MSDELSDDELARILDAIDVIEESLKRLAETRDAVDRSEYRADPDTQAMVERRFVKMTRLRSISGRYLSFTSEETHPKAIRKRCSIWKNSRFSPQSMLLR